jgi:O-antigen ligase
MKQRSDSADAGQQGPLPRWFLVIFGAFLGLSLVKYGNPPIMEKWVTAPTNPYEFLLGSPWPITWAYGLLAPVGALGLLVARRKVTAPFWLLSLPLIWLIWQCLAAFWTVNSDLTKPTLAHFFACVACFYLGFFSLGYQQRLGSFWPGLICGFLVVIAVGWQQHFGGLEQTRQYFFLYIYPRLREIPPEYLKKISSSRIFSTLFYPNALAGALLLLLLPALQVVWQSRQRFTVGARIFLVSAMGVGGLACLYWSGSKGGWLLMLMLVLIWALWLPISPRFKRVLIAAALILGLAGFVWKYSGFFQKGATSVGARFDYWAAAGKTMLSNPIVGTGPGTFSVAYQNVKRPESEMARLVHNDYLEQGSDSGVPGLILYTVFIVTALIRTSPLRDFSQHRAAPVREGFTQKPVNQTDSGHGSQSGWKRRYESPVRLALWLGVLGWCLHSLLEFGLYIPGLAWPAFAFIGLLLRREFNSEN